MLSQTESTTFGAVKSVSIKPSFKEVHIRAATEGGETLVVPVDVAATIVLDALNSDAKFRVERRPRQAYSRIYI